MMVDYLNTALGGQMAGATFGAQQTPNMPEVRPYLARIADAADELERIANYIEDFINRCRGGPESASAAGPVPVLSGHFGQLSRLQDNLDRVDKLARELQTIG